VDPETTRKTNRWWLSRPFLIIVVAGCFHVGRGALVDGIVFLGTAAALAVAEGVASGPRFHATGRHRQFRAAGGRLSTGKSRLPAAMALAAVPLGWVISTWGLATIAVVVAGPPMLYLALTTGGTVGRPRSGWWLWAVVGVLTCLWELAQFLQQPDARTDSWDHPTLSVVLDPLVASGPGRTVLVIVWLVAGVHLARLMLGSRRCIR
jgi:hypothetical protein